MFERITETPSTTSREPKSRCWMSRARRIAQSPGDGTLVSWARGAAQTERINAAYPSATAPRARGPSEVSWRRVDEATAMAGRYLPWPSRACTAALKAWFRCCRPLALVLLFLQHDRQHPIRQRQMSSGARCRARCRPAISCAGVELVKDARRIDRAYKRCSRMSAAPSQEHFGAMNRELGERNRFGRHRSRSGPYPRVAARRESFARRRAARSTPAPAGRTIALEAGSESGFIDGDQPQVRAHRAA